MCGLGSGYLDGRNDDDLWTRAAVGTRGMGKGWGVVSCSMAMSARLTVGQTGGQQTNNREYDSYGYGGRQV